YEERTEVEWTLKSVNDNSTFVSIVNKGFIGNTTQLISQIRDSTEGFTLVLAGLKAYLEYGLQLNLIADRFPKEVV
ncbi:MAG: polyketide cyclase, partial [Ignavibacteria bacterium]|nr:polyketide cyclase [Ignavibacteria bacterium]